MNYYEAIKFIDKKVVKNSEYTQDISVISKKEAYILAEIMCKTNVCNNCKHLNRLMKSYDECNLLDINIGAEMVLEFSCSEWSEK